MWVRIIREEVSARMRKKWGCKVVVCRGDQRTFMKATAFKDGNGIWLNGSKLKFCRYRWMGSVFRKGLFLRVENDVVSIYDSERNRWWTWRCLLDSVQLEGKPYRNEGGVTVELDDLEWFES